MEPLPIILPNLGLNRVVFGEGQEEYKPLPGLKGGTGNCMFRYHFSDEERRAVAEGRDILLSVLTYGQPLQPQYIEVEDCPRSAEDAAAWNDIIPLLCACRCGQVAKVVVRAKRDKACVIALCDIHYRAEDMETPDKWEVVKYADQAT
jgi:hypothetical protein